MASDKKLPFKDERYSEKDTPHDKSNSVGCRIVIETKTRISKCLNGWQTALIHFFGNSVHAFLSSSTVLRPSSKYYQNFF